jgi:hypothetical protein
MMLIVYCMNTQFRLIVLICELLKGLFAGYLFA